MRPIYDGLINKKEIVNFTMPGHKGRLEDLPLNRLDVTETYETDNLHQAEGIIKDSLAYASRVYGTRQTLYMVNGSTGALQVAILSSSQPGDEVLVQRNSHMAVYHSLILARLRPKYFYPEVKDGVTGQVSLEGFKQALEESKAKLAIFTYPSYEGYGSDLKTMIDLAHKKGMLVIVDQAHGAHLNFTDRLIPSALKLGADLVIESAHKSLPALTQTSLLHINSPRVDLDRLKEFSKIFQTSSPSYVFMASLEGAIAYMDSQEGREGLDRMVDYCMDFHDQARLIRGISLPPVSAYGKDISRFHLGLRGYRGEDLGLILYKNYGINIEYADYKYIVGIGSLMNEREDFQKLLYALEDLGPGEKEEDFIPPYLKDQPQIAMDISQAFYRPKVRIKPEEALGRISGGFIVPYPPGIALIGPGEIFSQDHIDIIKTYKDHKISILNGDRIEVVDE